MAKLLFKLNSVPDDEADDIRELLDENSIEFYETTPGLLGLSFAAIWLNNETQFNQAAQLINEYQAARYQAASESFQTRVAEGTQPTLWQAIKQRPIIFTLVGLFIATVLYLSVSPFFGAMEGLK